jgi:hypothetical protein
MANSNRTALLNKAHRVFKSHYKPVPVPRDRPLMEHMLFACCLENAPYEAADKVFEHLKKSFFDWNEMRVSTVTELSEAMHALPDAISAAANLKRVLQGVFESTYSFDMEALKKQNIGVGIKELEKLVGGSHFAVGYTTHAALDGHSIPLDRGALDVLFVLGVITESECSSGKVSGLERIIPKSKGAEFSSLLHQMAADYVANPFSPNVRKLLLSINPDAKDRFPKRGVKKEPEPPLPAPAAVSVAGKTKGAVPQKPAGKGTDKQPEKAPEKSAQKPVHAEKAAHADKTHGQKAHAEKSKAADKHTDKHAEKHSEKHAEKHSDKHAEKPSPRKKIGPPTKSSKPHPHPLSAKRKPAAKQLSKRKPR